MTMQKQIRCDVLNLVASSTTNEPDVDTKTVDEIVDWLLEGGYSDAYKMEAVRIAFRDKHAVSNGSALARAKTYHAYINKDE